jgi:hypothetical protein
MTFQISVVAGGRIKLYEAVIYKHTGMDTQKNDLGHLYEWIRMQALQVL